MAIGDRIDLFGDGQNDRGQTTRGSRFVRRWLLRPVKGGHRRQPLQAAKAKRTLDALRAAPATALSCMGSRILVVKERFLSPWHRSIFAAWWVAHGNNKKLCFWKIVDCSQLVHVAPVYEMGAECGHKEVGEVKSSSCQLAVCQRC